MLTSQIVNFYTDKIITLSVININGKATEKE